MKIHLLFIVTINLGHKFAVTKISVDKTYQKVYNIIKSQNQQNII